MAEYRNMTLAQFADAARNSNPELGANGQTLIDYFTGRAVGVFQDHDGEPGSGAETALFLASAREIVLELIRRLNEKESQHGA